jgi:hypothetical protein
MHAITPEVIDYYETILHIAETENVEINVLPGEMREFIASARATTEAKRIVRANEEEVRLVRMASAPTGANVAPVRAAFARHRLVATLQA